MLNINSIRTQFLFVITALLLIPVLVMLYDIFYATKSDEAILADREARLGSIVETHLAPAITQNFNNRLADEHFLGAQNRGDLMKDTFKEVAAPLADLYPGVRIGLYLPETEEISIEGYLHEYTHGSNDLTAEDHEERVKRILSEADTGLLAVVASHRSLARLTSSLDDHTFEYLAPIIVHGKLEAVVWADERIHPIFSQTKHFRLITRYITLLVIFASGIGAFMVVHNLAGVVDRIKHGLRDLEQDLTRLMPVVPGEEGQIARAVNRMAKSLAGKEKLEEDLHRSQRLAALGRLVTGMAHELRNPIGIIKTTVQVMEGEFKGNPAMKEFFEVIKEQVDRQNRVIQELLDFGRPSKTIVENVNVDKLISKVLVFTGPVLKQHMIKVLLDIEPSLPPVKVDGERIKQVFVNLILNAVQAMPDGGELRIAAVKLESAVNIAFTDNGEGIDENDIKHIFDPFFTTVEGGTGLGLSISYQIVTSHGGVIEVESQINKGSTFTVSLPIDLEEGASV